MHRSHAPRGNASGGRSASHAAGAAQTALPRGAWERWKTWLLPLQGGGWEGDGGNAGGMINGIFRISVSLSENLAKSIIKKLGNV